MTKPLDELDDEMLSAMLDWRQRKGRSWKEALLIAWMNGDDGRDRRCASLRHIRNRLGPDWLDKLRPKDLADAAAARGITAVQLPTRADKEGHSISD